MFLSVSWIVDHFVDAGMRNGIAGLENISNVSHCFPFPGEERTILETLKKGCRRLGFSQLLDLDEKVEDLAVLWEDDLAVFGYITAKHFPVSFRTGFHGFSFLERVHLLRLAP